MKANNLLLKTSNESEFIIDGSKLYQASIAYGKNEFLKILVLQLKKDLFLFLINIVTNFTFRNKIGKVFGYTNIYNFVHTTEPSQLSTGLKCFKTQFF